MIALRCTAQTSAGAIESERLTIVHVPEDVLRPSGAADLRTLATAAGDRLVRNRDGALPRVTAWFEEVQREHASTVDAHTAREATLLGRRTDATPVQRGLFDTRAVAAADRQSALDAAVLDTSRERIRRLEEARRLQLNVTPAGVRDTTYTVAPLA